MPPRKRKTKKKRGRVQRPSAKQKRQGPSKPARKTDGSRKAGPRRKLRRSRQIKDLTPAERDRVRQRSADRKRQRAAKAKGKAVSSAEAIRRCALQERVPIYRKAKPAVHVPLERILVDAFTFRYRRRLLSVLQRRLRQLSPESKV